jgi:uncharacterized protein YggE
MRSARPFILLVVLAISSARSAAAAESAAPPLRSAIRVVARATVSVKPDQGELDLGVTTDKKTAAAAVAENDRRMERVLAALKKEVGTDGDVKTSELSVRPRFEESRSGLPTQHILGYTVTNTVQVRVANTRAVGRLLDLAFQAGANTVERVGFTLKDPEAAQNQALRAASAKARTRATAMAEGQGLRVGEVISVSEGEGFDSSVPFEGAYEKYKARANVLATPLEAGSIEVTATVTVLFALKAR